MFTKIALLSTFALGALAQSSTVVSLYGGPSSDSGSNGYAGSVVSADASQTTYAIVCTSGDTNCDTSATFTMTEGPSMYNAVDTTTSDGAEATVSNSCSLGVSSNTVTTAVCTQLEVVSIDGESTSVTSSVTLSGSSIYMRPVTITAGAEKLASATATGSSSGAAATAMAEVYKVLIPGAALLAGAMM